MQPQLSRSCNGKTSTQQPAPVAATRVNTYTKRTAVRKNPNSPGRQPYRPNRQNSIGNTTIQAKQQLADQYCVAGDDLQLNRPHSCHLHTNITIKINKHKINEPNAMAYIPITQHPCTPEGEGSTRANSTNNAVNPFIGYAE